MSAKPSVSSGGFLFKFYMRKLSIILAIVIVVAFEMYSCNNTKPATNNIHALVSIDIAVFQKHLSDTLLVYVSNKKPVEEIRKAFLDARNNYKQFEWAAEYFMPSTTRLVNGAPVPEIENEEHKVTDAEGLQVVESILFPEYDLNDSLELKRQIGLLIASCRKYDNYWSAIEIDSAQVFDAVKLEVFRIISLGISGYDNAIALNGINEAATALSACHKALSYFGPDKTLDSLFTKSIRYLQANPDFNQFNRMQFIRDYANLLTTSINRCQQQKNIDFVNDNRLLKPSAATLFDKDAFDMNAYISDTAFFFTKEKAFLGQKLFYDVTLSTNNGRSCASCHHPDKAFTDGVAKSAALISGSVKRNAPSLLNAALQPWQFYDMRATNLENQAEQVITHKDEMHGNLTASLQLLKKDSVYIRMFAMAYPGVTITEKHIQNALASYIRSLSKLNSRFDEYMRSNGAMLSPQEIDGFNIFMSKGKCGTCHFLPLFNGTLPPGFTKMDSEVLGVPANKNFHEIDSDSGRYLMYKVPPYLFSFKTTSVRNAALTAPYMHNGVFDTLEEVMSFYNNGGGVGSGLNLTTQTLPADSLKLSKTEIGSLITFIKSLNTQTVY